MSPPQVVAALCFLASLRGAAPLSSQDPIPESEPNDSIATADTAVLGGRVSGHNDSRHDVDYWVLVGVRAGDTIYVDVDANEFHSTMVPYLHLETSDGQPLALVASWVDGQDPYVVAVAPKTGTYYLRVSGKVMVEDQAFFGSGPAAFYTINFSRASCPVISSEQEPNNSRATARTLALNSTISALSCPDGDADLYRLDVSHPARINVEMFTPEQWRPAMGNPRNPPAKNLAVYASDSTLLATRQWRMSERDSFQLSFDADHAGPYYITASTYPGGFRFTYTLRASETLYHGPGDPIVKLKDSLSARGLAVSSAGDLYVSDGYRYRILKISPAGAVSEFVNGIRAHGLAFDGLGNLYAMGVGEEGANYGLYRITPDGHATILSRDVTIVGPAIGPDGSIWMGAPSEPGAADYYSVRRYDQSGRLLASYPIIGERDGGVTELAFSPSGQLYVATVATVYRFKNGQFEKVLQDAKFIRGFAIDSAGRFYVSTAGDHSRAYAVEGRIDLYDADGTVLKSPFARTPVFPSSLAFGRNSDGSPNRRLFFLDGSLGEVKPGSIEIPGARAPVASQRALRELMRPGSVLTAAERDELDAKGNRNGHYDIGDLRMLLVRYGALP